jgi:hypothetical protein
MSAKHAQQPRLRPPMSAEQRAKLSAAQRAYVACDPRWAAHRQRLAASMRAANPALHPPMTLLPDEIARIKSERRKGRTWEYLAEELCVCRHVMLRELKAAGYPTAAVRAERRAMRGKGFWRSFDEP